MFNFLTKIIAGPTNQRNLVKKLNTESTSTRRGSKSWRLTSSPPRRPQGAGAESLNLVSLIIIHCTGAFKC